MGSLSVGADVEAPLVKDIEEIRTLSQQMMDVADRCLDATVAIVSRGGSGAGSGVIVSEDGLVLTAAHVMEALTDEVMVILPDGRRFAAEKLGADFNRDAAMIRITDSGEFPHVEVGDSAGLRRNDWCVALGHPGGYDPMRTPPLRLGRILSADHWLVTDSAVVGGDSGGPLFDAEGRLIGIHSNIGMTLSQNRHVPIGLFLDQWDAMLDGRRVGNRFGNRTGDPGPNRPAIGVRLGDGSDRGVEIAGVIEGSPAEESGLQAGDILSRVAGRSITSPDEFIERINRLSPGDEVRLVVLRDGEQHRFTVPLVSLDQLADPEASPRESDEDTEEPQADADADERGSADGDEANGSDDEDNADEGAADDQARAAAETAEEKLDRYLDSRIGEMRDGNLRLELTPEMLEEFGGMDRLMERLQERFGGELRRQLEEGLEPDAAEMPEMDESEGPDVADAADETGDEDGAERAGGPTLDELIDRALEQGEGLQLTPGQIRRFGGTGAVARRMRQRMAELSPDQRQRFLESQRAANRDAFFESLMDALDPVAKKAADSVASVTVDDEPAALGTFVSTDGWLLTKDVETSAGEVAVVHAGETYPADLVQRFPEHDLALFKVAGDRFTPVEWCDDEPPLGSVLTAVGPERKALGMGLVSVIARALGQVGYLGVATEDEDQGIRVTRVMGRSAAEGSGLEQGDLIVTLNGNGVGDTIAFGESIRGIRAGETVTLGIERQGEAMDIEVELGERPATGGNANTRFRRMNEMSGRMSERTGGFPMVLQHDIPLDPSQCGGPLLDLDGRCVGINVSRAGRVNTYAVPANVVRELLESIDEDDITDAEMEAVRDLIRELRGNLDALEERLEQMEAR